MPKIYTKTGDAGETGLFTGKRVPKDHPLLDAYGTVDELNALLGAVRAEKLPKEIDAQVERVQNELFDLGADLACPWEDRESPQGSRIQRISSGPARRLETEIDAAENELSPLRQFILPGGCRCAALLHLARTVCRRGERQLIALLRAGKCNPEIGVYMNRLSDWLFVMARFANLKAGVPDVPWRQGRET